MENHLPTFFVCVQSDNVADLIETATLNGNPSNLRQISNAVQAANEVWISAANNHAGKVASIFGDEVSIEFPIKELDSVEDWQRQHTEASDITCCVGVGHTLNEAKRALMAAQLIAPGTIKCYTSLVEQILASTAGLAKSEDLEKARPGPKFPKLGVPDDRRETDIVETPRQLKIKQLAGLNAEFGDLKEIERKALAGPEGFGRLPRKYPSPQLKEKRLQELNERRPIGSVPKSSKTKASYALGGDLLHSASNIPVSPNAIQHHENAHMMLNRVQEKHGHLARQNLASNLWHHVEKSIGPEMANTLDAFLNRRYPKQHRGDHDHEERLATVLNLVNDPAERQGVLNDPKYKQFETDDIYPLMRAAKGAHRAIQSAGKAADENWLQHPSIFQQHYSKNKDSMFKSESTDLRLDFRNLVDELDTITTVHDEALNVQTEEHQELDDLKAEVRGVLDEIHSSLPQLELLEQTSPAAYHVIVALLRSVEDLAEKLFGDDDEDSNEGQIEQFDVPMDETLDAWLPRRG